MEFKVGDRVTTKLNQAGTIIDTEKLFGNVAVEMDNKRDGVVSSAFPGKHILWLPVGDWKKIEQKSKILITTDGHTTTARLYDGKKVVKSATAKCAPDDKFDFVTGAKLAFDRLMGTSIIPIGDFWYEWANDTHLGAKPKEAKPAEPIKLYCVKSYKPGEWLTKGKVYEFTDNERPERQIMHYDTHDIKWGDWKGRYLNETKLTDLLVPLVSRPAKVGEWVLIVDEYCTFGDYKNGDVLRALEVRGNGYINNYGVLDGVHINEKEYLVLDGYQPEEKEYLNMKVVCVDDAGLDTITKGAVYTFIDGWSKDNNGNTLFSSPMKSLEEINDRTRAKFIEFKGEA